MWGWSFAISFGAWCLLILFFFSHFVANFYHSLFWMCFIFSSLLKRRLVTCLCISRWRNIATSRSQLSLCFFFWLIKNYFILHAYKIALFQLVFTSAWLLLFLLLVLKSQQSHAAISLPNDDLVVLYGNSVTRFESSQQGSKMWEWKDAADRFLIEKETKKKHSAKKNTEPKMITTFIKIKWCKFCELGYVLI